MLEVLRRLGLPSVSASTQGPQIDNIISIVHWLMLILFVGWGAYFIFTLIKFRASKNPKADYKGVRNHYSSYIEGLVAVIEIALLFGFAFPIWASRVNDVPVGTEVVQIRVIGQQYLWNFHYPGPDGVFGKTSVYLVDEAENPIGLDRNDSFAKDDFYVPQMHIPVNTPINISLSTKDVIHNFKLPEFRVSQDAIPGMTIPVWFEATMTSDEFLKTTIGTKREGRGFEIACAQLCGLGHSKMRGYLNVYDSEGYSAWQVSEQEYLLEQEDDDDWGDDDW
ncbi:MAG: cytochrome c oxidase subunit II [Fidelibacterota bacterium]